MDDAQALKNLNVMTTEGVAAAAGLTVGTIRVMVVRTRKRRDEGDPLPTDLPEPDLMVFRSPLWRKSTITQWLKRRETLLQVEGDSSSQRRRRVTRKSVARSADSAKASKKATAKVADKKATAKTAKAAPKKAVAKKVPAKKSAPRAKAAAAK